MSSIFTRIINGEIPCYKIAETDQFFAFLDIRPLTLGHTLVIPKVEVDYIFDLDNETYVGLQVFAKIIAEAQKRAFSGKRIGMVVMGLEVPHAHIHLIPFSQMEEMNFANEKLNLGADQMMEIANKIRAQIGH